LESIKFHLGTSRAHSFNSETETELFTNLEDGENGREVLTETMRVLGNYTLADAIMAGSLWTIDNQNHYISCEGNINTRLDEHDYNEHGDVLLQGDMAVTSVQCHYTEQSSKVSNISFSVDTSNCFGVSACQFEHPDEAVHFCNRQPECTMIMGKADESGCDGGFGCYVPKKGEAWETEAWREMGGSTYIKHCPGALLEMQEAVQAGLRETGNKWKNGEVAYCFSAEVRDVTQEAVRLAAQRIHQQVPCVTFNYVPRSNDTHCSVQPSIIITSKESGCWSFVGQVSGTPAFRTRPGSQQLNLDTGCELEGIVLHELGHALGMLHETSRGDRIKYMKTNIGNMKEGKEKHFQTSQDSTKFAWSPYGDCKTRAGKTKVKMPIQDCMKARGYYENSSVSQGDEQDEADEGEEGPGEHVECRFDLCEDGIYFPAPFGECGTNGSAKLAPMKIMMQRNDCSIARGKADTNDVHTEYYHWTACEFDLCRSHGLHLAKPFACENKLAYGYITTPGADCQNMEGNLNIDNVGANWTNCYFDFCSGRFDTPFDFLSLMMYSPYAWSINKSLTLEPLGNHSDIISTMMGQRMGFSGLDIFHLGHMYNCWNETKPFFDSKDVSRDILSGKFFEFNGTCEDQTPEKTGFDVHGEMGFMKHASCNELRKDCHNEIVKCTSDGNCTNVFDDPSSNGTTLGSHIRSVCPVSCFVCMPNHGVNGVTEGGPCFDAVNTGIRFRNGPAAGCKDLLQYCHNEAIGSQVREACKLTCGFCDPVVYAPFYDDHHSCEDIPKMRDPVFTIGGEPAACMDMTKYCQNHVESYLVQRKCPLTCGVCGTGLKEHEMATEFQDDGDNGGCNRRRRFGFCSTRRRRNI
jgi:hypothetical protein